MGKSSRRNRKKNSKQFKINQQNAIKNKKAFSHQRSKGYMKVNGSKCGGGSCGSAKDRQCNQSQISYIFRNLTDYQIAAAAADDWRLMELIRNQKI